MYRWQSGPMHRIANPKNREFKSHSVLQIQNVSLTVTLCTNCYNCVVFVQQVSKVVDKCVGYVRIHSCLEKSRRSLTS